MKICERCGTLNATVTVDLTCAACGGKLPQHGSVFPPSGEELGTKDQVRDFAHTGCIRSTRPLDVE